MDEREHRVLHLLRHALDTAPDDRESFLSIHCEGDTALRQRVDALLRGCADEAAENAAAHPHDASPALPPARDDPLLGTRLGPFRVIERIGRGGMGVVYRGEREGADFRQQVALKLIRRGFDFDDVQARFLEAIVSTKTGALRVISLYLPNGNPPDTDKYNYKLNWMNRLINFSHERLKLEEPMVLAGDYNVIPTAADVRRPEAWKNDALFLPQTREKYRALINLGLTDAVRAVSDDPDLYTFWDYHAGDWPKNDGIRIDHLLLSPQAADRLTDAGIDRHVRGWDKPSDHVPVYIDLDIEGR